MVLPERNRRWPYRIEEEGSEIWSIDTWANRPLDADPGQLIYLMDTGGTYQLFDDGAVKEYVPDVAYANLSGGSWKTYLKGDVGPGDPAWPAEWVPNAGNTVAPVSDGTWLLCEGMKNSLDADLCFVEWMHGLTWGSWYLRAHLKADTPTTGGTTTRCTISLQSGESNPIGIGFKANEFLWAWLATAFIDGLGPPPDFAGGLIDHFVEIYIEEVVSGFHPFLVWVDHALVATWPYNRVGTSGLKRIWFGDGTGASRGNLWVRELRVASSH